MNNKGNCRKHLRREIKWVIDNVWNKAGAKAGSDHCKWISIVTKKTCAFDGAIHFLIAGTPEFGARWHETEDYPAFRAE